MDIHNPSATPVFYGAPDEAYNASQVAAAWTDLDLSSIVGTNICLVLLRVTHTAAGRQTSWRQNGDSSDFLTPDFGGEYPGTNQAADGGKYTYIWLLTDTNGVVEYYSTSTASVDLIVHVMAWIK